MIFQTLPMVDVAANYRAIQGRIAEAALRSSREPGEIKLLAAAKSQSIEAIRAAIAAGIKLIGENYVQEAQDKRRAISETAGWHMIGPRERVGGMAHANSVAIGGGATSVRIGTALFGSWQSEICLSSPISSLPSLRFWNR